MDIITKYGEIQLDYSRWIKLYYEMPSLIDYLDCKKNYDCQFDLSSNNVECKILFTNKSFARSLQFNLRKNTEKYYTMIDIPNSAFLQLYELIPIMVHYFHKAKTHEALINSNVYSFLNKEKQNHVIKSKNPMKAALLQVLILISFCMNWSVFDRYVFE
jgi:hypothetical protein